MFFGLGVLGLLLEEGEPFLIFLLIGFELGEFMEEMFLLILGMLLGNISRGDLDPYEILFNFSDELGKDVLFGFHSCYFL